jgi:hypothetical protein
LPKTLVTSSSVSSLKKKVEQFNQVVEEEKKKGSMNKAEIYQAVRKARLRSNYINKDLVFKTLGTS